MINSSLLLEKKLQHLRFNKVKTYLKGDVLDFGGNRGELKEFVKGHYYLVNYDHSIIDNEGLSVDTIVSLAVIEHMTVGDVVTSFRKFKRILRKGGRIILTTPTKMSKPVLEFLALIRLLDKKNIEEHKHYWNKNELFQLAVDTGFEVKMFKRFQLGFNQWVVLQHKEVNY
nr:methyltransferase domain-containing protein [uncultured Draconibacterium sp.]